MDFHNLRTALASLVLAVTIGANGLMAQDKPVTIIGGGKTMLVGGDGGMMQDGDATKPTPVITLLSFQATMENGVTSGRFECLALGPKNPPSFQVGSGEFSKNIMYVTGDVNGMEIIGSQVTIKGKALITGVGAGVDLDYRFEIQEGGPGAFMVLTTQNPDPAGQPMVFKEQMIEGEVRIIR